MKSEDLSFLKVDDRQSNRIKYREAYIKKQDEKGEEKTVVHEKEVENLIKQLGKKEVDGTEQLKKALED